MIVAERAARIAAQAELTDARAEAADARAEAANAQADLTSSEALIAHLKLAIEKLRRELYGTRSERRRARRSLSINGLACTTHSDHGCRILAPAAEERRGGRDARLVASFEC